MPPLGEGPGMEEPRHGLAWGPAAGTAQQQHLTFAIAAVGGRASLHLSPGGCPPVPSTLPFRCTPGCWGTGVVPLLPALLQGLARMGIKYEVKRKKVFFFFPVCILSTAPTQRSKYRIFYPPPFQAISMLKYRQETGC